MNDSDDIRFVLGCALLFIFVTIIALACLP
jgi:hypothetical protein